MCVLVSRWWTCGGICAGVCGGVRRSALPLGVKGRRMPHAPCAGRRSSQPLACIRMAPPRCYRSSSDRGEAFLTSMRSLRMARDALFSSHGRSLSLVDMRDRVRRSSRSGGASRSVDPFSLPSRAAPLRVGYRTVGRSSEVIPLPGSRRYSTFVNYMYMYTCTCTCRQQESKL